MDTNTLQFIVDTYPNPTLFIDNHGRLEYLNQAAEHNLGVHRDCLLGQLIIEALFDGHTKYPDGRYVFGIMETMETGRSFYNAEQVLCTPYHESPAVVLLTSVPVTDQAGNKVGIYATYEDITVSKMIEEIVFEKESLLTRINTEIISAFSTTIGTRDKYTQGHSEKVAQLAHGIGLALDLDPVEIEKLSLASILHDIGKIGVPEDLLNKPAALSREEYETMKEHPRRGAGIIAKIKALEELSPIVLSHHERWDGMGYPQGLKGEEIPFLSRIIAVADTWEAMTADRVYRKPLPRERCIEELVAGRGTQFEPRIVDAFLDILNKFEFRETQ